MLAELLPLLAALMVGFIAGLLAFRAKSRWCPSCGGMTIQRCATGGTAVSP